MGNRTGPAGREAIAGPHAFRDARPVDFDAAFDAFIAEAEALLDDRVTVLAFERFAAEAETIVLGDARAGLDALIAASASIEQWAAGAHDLFDEAGITGREDPTTELLRWLLEPDVHPASAVARQEGSLRAIGWDGAAMSAPATLRTQWPTAEGPIVDLLIELPEQVVVVEAKTGTDEHEAGATGKLQTDFYADAARRQRPRTLDPFVVFMTTDGRPPRGTAVATTYAAAACGVLHGLAREARSMAPPTREAFRIVLVHLLRHGGPVDLTRASDLVAKLRAGGAAWTPEELRTLVLAMPFMRMIHGAKTEAR